MSRGSDRAGDRGASRALLRNFVFSSSFSSRETDPRDANRFYAAVSASVRRTLSRDLVIAPSRRPLERMCHKRTRDREHSGALRC